VLPPTSRKLTRYEAKRHNRRLVLRTIYQAGEISRADIARATGLTRTTSSSAVADLMEEGLVEELGQGPSAGGKPPTILHVAQDARHVAGVDLGGLTLRGAVFDLRGSVCHQATVPLNTGDGNHVLDLVLDLLDRLVELADRPLLGIGVGLPGLIDVSQGIVHQAVNLGWRQLPLMDLLAQRYHLPIGLVNDSQAAALAEYTFANPDRVRDLAVILIKRGISAGLIFNGLLHHGTSRSGASEIGHVRVVEDGELCACGHRGCLETVASQRAVLHMAQDIYDSHPQSSLRQFAAASTSVDMDAVLRALEAGDPLLASMVEGVGRYLGIAAANLVSVANVPLVVLAGSVARFGNPLVEVVGREMRDRSLASLAEQVQVRVSELGDDIVMKGAAAAMLASELGVV
jgi:glucokinase-like ROK family protein